MNRSGRSDPPSRDPRERTEPVLGDLDRLGEVAPDARAPRGHGLPSVKAEPDLRPYRARAAAPRHGARNWIIGIVVAIVALGAAWGVNHLRADLPRTQLNALLARGDQALAQGKLSGAPDSARDLYEAARALDPDSEHALQGLQNVGRAELQRARTALAAGKLDDARGALDDAREILGGGADVQALDAALAKAQDRGAAQDALIDRAQAALDAGRLDGDDGAAALFRRVLAGAPDNAVARHGMDRVGAALARRVQDQLGKQDLASAQRTLDRLAALLPNYAALPSLRANVAQVQQQAAAAREQHLAQGQADLRAGKFTGTDDDNALAQFNAVLAADPDNAAAHAGLGQVAQALIVQANAALDAERPLDAQPLLDEAAKLAPKSADLAAARSRMLALAKQPNAYGHANAIAAQSAPPALTPAQSARIERLVQHADIAARQGNLMLPPGDSAYDLYRAALAIDGDDAQAQVGLRALPERARTLFGQALNNGRLDRASDLLATLGQLSPGDPALDSMQRRLGDAWIDRASQLADQGRSDDARRALDEARRLTPGNPRIDEVDARIGYGN